MQASNTETKPLFFNNMPIDVSVKLAHKGIYPIRSTITESTIPGYCIGDEVYMYLISDKNEIIGTSIKDEKGEYLLTIKLNEDMSFMDMLESYNIKF